MRKKCVQPAGLFVDKLGVNNSLSHSQSVAVKGWVQKWRFSDSFYPVLYSLVGGIFTLILSSINRVKVTFIPSFHMSYRNYNYLNI
jgi:hypothetical protein